MNLNVAYPVLGVYIILVMGAGLVGVVLNLRNSIIHRDKVREHFTTTGGLGHFVWFFTMLATLFSGYSVSGIVNEAYSRGWLVTRWISAGVGIYVAFALMAPRLHSLGKSRGYFTLSQYLHDRFLPKVPGGRAWVSHAVALLAFFCLQLPVFTYLITQFQSLGREVLAFTSGGIDYNTSVLTAAGILLILDILGGMRAVAFTDVLQGLVLFLGSIIFLIIQRSELGGLHRAWEYFSNPAITGGKPVETLNGQALRVWNVQHVPTRTDIVNYFDFVAKTTIAATMFPHLVARLFAARSAGVMRRGLAAMNFTFFIVQLSSMIVGWTAIYALKDNTTPGSAFGRMLRLVSTYGNGQAFAAALLLASAICVMMSTPDSALLAFSGMWVRDIYNRYIRRNAGQLEQIIFGKVMAFAGLSIGVGLAMKTLQTGKPDLSGLFALQTVTPIHVAPAVWLSLHWRRLRGEAVFAGMVVGLAITLGLVFSDANLDYKIGNDRLDCGLSSALVGFFANFGLTVVLGLAMEYFPGAFKWLTGPVEDYDAIDAAAAVATAADDAVAADINGAKAVAEGAEGAAPEAAAAAAAPATVAAPAASNTPAVDDSDSSSDMLTDASNRPLDIGPKRDRALNPVMWLVIFLLLLFTTPFYRVPRSWDGYVGDIGAWTFTSLFLAGMLAIAGLWVFLVQWEDYIPYNPFAPKPLEAVAVDGTKAAADDDNEQPVKEAVAAPAAVAVAN